MSDHDSPQHRGWWALVLVGVLTLAFGIAAVLLPAAILTARLLDVIFGVAKPLSGSFTAVAAFLALVALVLIDGLLSLFGKAVTGKHASTIRGVVGLAVAIIAIFWPGRVVFVAVELIGLWALLVGILEILFARYSDDNARDRALHVIAAIALIVMGVGLMRWVFLGAIVVSVLVGIAAAVRGVSLIVIGVSRRLHGKEANEKQMVERSAA
jgi:uncharacterized membrane protein HdeD (DUF308 family)